MAEMKKIATRESYGNALKELGAVNEKVVVMRVPQRPLFLEMHILNAISTAELQSVM